MATADPVAVAGPADPFCWSCDDTGRVELFHPSTDGLIGHRPCGDPECVKRREDLMERTSARAAEEQAEELRRRQEHGDPDEPPF